MSEFRKIKFGDGLTVTDEGGGVIRVDGGSGVGGGGGGGGVDSVSAGDASVTIAGTATDPTVAVATGGVGPTQLAATAVTPGSYGDATHVGQFTVDADGRLTAAADIAISGSGGSPTGAAGGALDGSYPNPGLATSVAGSGLAETSDVLSVNVDGSTLEINADALRVKAGGIGANEIAATAVAAGSYGDGTHVGAFTVDADGRLTAASSVTITGAAPSGSAGGDLTGTYPNPTLAAAGPGATGPIGDATHVAAVTIDAKGRVTALSSVAISGGSGAGALLYDYEVTGSDKASIDTFVDDGGGGVGAALSGAYRVLEMFLYARTDEAVVASGINMNLNNDTTAIYDRQRIRGANTTASANIANSDTKVQTLAPGANAVAGAFGPSQITIHNYAGTVGNKAGQFFTSVVDNTTGMIVDVWAFDYRSTSAVTRVAFAPATALKKFKVGTRLTIFAR